MEEIENVIGESYDGHAFSIAVTDLWTAVEELSKDPTAAVKYSHCCLHYMKYSPASRVHLTDNSVGPLSR